MSLFLAGAGHRACVRRLAEHAESLMQTPGQTQDLVRYALLRISTADLAPAAFCSQLLADRELYKLPPTIPSAQWRRALQYVVSIAPDMASFEVEMAKWPQWPPVPETPF